MELWAIAVVTIVLSSSSIALHAEKVEDVYSKCFHTSIHDPDPARPECIKGFVHFAIDMQTRFNLTKNEINYLFSLEREIQEKFHNHRRMKRQAPLIIRRECRLMGDIQRQRLFLAINILKRHTTEPVFILYLSNVVYILILHLKTTTFL